MERSTMNTHLDPNHNKISRRRFLQFSCLSMAGVALTLCGNTGASSELSPIAPSATAFGDKNINHPILIVYATYAGSTQEVAIEMGKVLGDRGFPVDVIPAVENPQVDGYQFVLIGSAVHGSRWLSEASEFIEANQASLSRIPVAFFSLCLAGLARNETSLASARDTIYSPLRAFITPVDEVLFAGKVDRRGVALGLPGWLARFFPTLDFRDWDKIRGWTRDLPFLQALNETGKLMPVIGQTYPQHHTPEVLHDLEEIHAHGKVVINVIDEDC
jgi:menaquinone-dependent protoporphyrinogen oxidase